MIGHPMRYAWERPKVIVCATASSRGFWRSSAVTDYSGALANESFYLVWSKVPELQPEVVCAMLNGLVAAKWLYAHGDKRHNKGVTYQGIPVPNLDPIESRMFTLKVRQIQDVLASDELLASRMSARIMALITEIDAAMLRAYRLPGDLAGQLIQEASSAKRPLPVDEQSAVVDWTKALERWDLDCEHQRCVEQYQSLVDASFSRELSQEEEHRKKWLEGALDQLERQLYYEEPGGPDVAGVTE